MHNTVLKTKNRTNALSCLNPKSIAGTLSNSRIGSSSSDPEFIVETVLVVLDSLPTESLSTEECHPVETCRSADKFRPMNEFPLTVYFLLFEIFPPAEVLPLSEVFPPSEILPPCKDFPPSEVFSLKEVEAFPPNFFPASAGFLVREDLSLTEDLFSTEEFLT